MFIILGLGNPGEKYKNTRHNAGFAAIDDFQKESGFSDWRKAKDFNAQISEGEIGNRHSGLRRGKESYFSQAPNLYESFRPSRRGFG